MRTPMFGFSLRQPIWLAALYAGSSSAVLHGCAVTEERASAMEQRITALEQADTESRLIALLERLSAVEAGTADAIATMQEKVEQHAASSASEPATPEQPEPEPEPAPEPAPTPSPNPAPAIANAAPPAPAAGEDSIWVAVDTVLGVERTPIAVEDNLYRVSRAWLRQQVDSMAATGRYPKIVSAKKGGVQIKGMRPESLGGQLGFKSQDVITAIDGKGVNTVDDVAAALRAAGNRVEVVVKRRREESVQVYVLVD